MTRRKAVLLIEDNLVIGEALRELLNGEAIEVDQATTEEEADDFIQTKTFDAIVLDGSLCVNSPDLDTLPLLSRIKNHGFPGLIIGFSGQSANNEILCAHGAHVGVVKTRMKEILEVLKR